MKQYLLLLFSILYLNSCFAQEIKPSTDTVFYTPGKIKSITYKTNNQQKDKTIISYDKDGIKESEINYRNNSKNGPSTWYYKDGKVKAQDMFKVENGNAEGYFDYGLRNGLN